VTPVKHEIKISAMETYPWHFVFLGFYNGSGKLPSCPKKKGTYNSILKNISIPQYGISG
jgi:hypothetical protein